MPGTTTSLAAERLGKLTIKTVALAGNPNSGKTTLFNSLTGLRQKVANYPGVTVEKKTGKCTLPGVGGVTVIDLPGTYSLVSRSPDEAVACAVLRGERKDTPAPDVVVVVVDAANLQRNLYLVSQLIELGRPLVVALTMTDIAKRRGLRVSAERLEGLLGVPVVPMVGHRGTGVEELKRRLPEARVAALPKFEIPAEMREELLLVGGALAIQEGEQEAAAADPLRLDRYKAMAERLLIGDRSPDLAMVYEREPVKGLLRGASKRLSDVGIDPMQADIEAHYRWIDEIASGALEPACADLTADPNEPVATGNSQLATLEYARRVPLTDRLDRVLIHKVWGLIVFTVIMAGMFVSIFKLAAPLMAWMQDGVGWLGTLVTSHIPDGPIHDLLQDGIFAGVGSVVVFVPQIAILFGFLAILEDSGYLARAAFLMDRLLSKVGLSGKAFIPLLSSFACAIPGIMATRTIESRKQRLATILVAPFMSCSARLPVYTLLIGTFFAPWGAWAQAGVMLSLYLLGILVAIATAWTLQRFGPREAAGGFILELPTYKVPQMSQVLRQIWSNTSKFITKAGTTIFCLSIVLWAMTYYPRLPASQVVAIESKNSVERFEKLAESGNKGLLTAPELEENREFNHRITAEVERLNLGSIHSGVSQEEMKKAIDSVKDKEVASAQLRHSISGRLGHFMEPAIRPLGYDWKMGIGLVSAFAAREVFVSTMGIVYSVGEVEDDTSSLSEAMRADRYADGRPVWTVPVAVSLLVWFVLAMQCMSTIAIVRRETGGWRWPILMTVYMNGVAYVASLLTYQILIRVMS